MGLDITYGKISAPALPVDPDDERIDANGEYIQRRANAEHFADRAKDVELEDFVFTDGGGNFGAGSYGTYNIWRNWLAALVGYRPTLNDNQRQSAAASCWVECEKGNNGPLWELIYFSDCEGVIGPEASGRLYDQMILYKPASDASLAPDRYKELFNKFLEAFRVARDGGAVVFH